MARRSLRLFPIDSGLNLNVNPFRLSPGESPDALNVDFDRGSAKASGGAIKFGNKVAPRPGVRCSPSKDGRLPVLYEKSAPVVGHVTLPWKSEQDIGGDFVVATHGSETDARSKRVFASRRGKSFGMKVSFRLPETEKLFSAPTNPTNSSTYQSTSDLRTHAGADLAIDEFTAIAQKGGDGMSPMSWALGVVNTGELLDVDVDRGDNVLGIPTTTYQQRPSNYMLCFMWLDAPGYGAWRPSGMRYLLTDGTVSEAIDGTGSGAHCTLAYRAMVVPVFVEPGRTYHVEMQLSMDTGTAGTGSTPTTDWEEDGRIDFFCKTDDDAVQQYSWESGGSNTVYRWKGPADSLEYFAKYGIRWSGREEMHLGLGYRCAPWTSAGFIHAGIDSAPMENGGYQVSDHSQASVTTYDDYDKPDQPPGAGNTKTVLHQLRCAHAASEDNVEINYSGMVDFGTGLAGEWGTETSVWDGIYIGGRHPWGIHDQAWQGLDPDQVGGVNTEALRGYRLVFQRDGDGVDSTDAAGFLLTINTMENSSAYAGATYSYRMTPETGLGFVDSAAADFGPGAGYTHNATFAVVVRAFRWHQRETEISDFRIYDAPRSYTDKQAEWSLWHETVLDDTLEPGVKDLVGLWPLTDGSGGVCKDRVAGNHGVFAPFALPQVDGGIEGEKQVYLSGEGERIQLDFSSNPALKDLLRQSLQDGKSGFAVQMRFRPTGAVYGQSRKIAGPPDGQTNITDNLWESKFAPDLIDWSVKDVDQVDSANGTDYHDHGQHVPLRPLLRFGHRIHTEFRIGDQTNTFGRSEAWHYPMPFDVKVGNNGDEEGLGLFVPNASEAGNTAFGYSWYQLTNVNVPRYRKDAEWANRTVTVQVGVEPSDTEETVNVYIAWTPSEALLSTTQPPNAEFAFYEQVTFHRKDLERSVLTIGGGSDPFERAWCEMGCKMFVDAVRVFGAAAPGDLPTSAGAAVAAGTGKILGGHAHPDRELEVEDILRPVGGGTQAVTVTRRSSTVNAAGNAEFPLTRPEADLESILGTFLQVQDERLLVPTEEGLPKTYPKAYFIERVTATALILARPYEGDTKVGVAASTFRIIGYSSFGDAIQDKPLPLGKGKPLTYGETLVGDAVQTAVYWKNPAPGGADWRVTLLSPVAVGRATDIHPRWCRGLVSSRGNRILGLKALEQVLYAAAQGSLFEADDRWRLSGPTRTINRALHVRARRDDQSGFAMPLQDDRVVFDDASVITSPSSGRQLFFDGWVKLDGRFPVQTIVWVGREDSDPSKDVNGTNGHEASWWFRLRDGHPELAVGSTGLVGGSAPEKGLFVAKAEGRVPVGEWAHVRALIERDSANYIEPVFWINGKLVPTIIQEREDTLSSPNWMIGANAVGADANQKVVIGCARDSELEVSDSGDDAIAAPDRRQGWMHSLAGEVSCVVISTQLDEIHFKRAENFDPRAIDYDTAPTGWAAFVRVLSVGGEVGVGHMVYDSKQDRYGRIHSHPLISLWHEMGDSENPVSFATYEREIYAANGGRVAIIENREVRPAGLLAPVSVPDFELLRDPLYEVNTFDSTGDVGNDALVQLDNDDPTVTERAYHLNVPGSTYIRQLGDSNMDWGPNKFFAWSALLRMDSVDGRIPLYSRRNSLRAGGPFVECRDGFVYVGWWDTSMKKEVYVRTSKPVIEPGFDTYIYVRKWYPRKGIQGATEKYWGGHTLLGSSNWINSQWDYDIQNTSNDLLCRDMLVVRKVPKSDLTSPENYADWSGFDAKASIDYPGGGTWEASTSSDRMSVSFVLADTDISTLLSAGEEYTVTGPVLVDTASFDAGDTDTIDISGVGQTFVLDHTGMLIQLAKRTSGTPSANFDGAVFRIVEVMSTTKVRVVDLDGNAPTFVAGDFPASIAAIVAPDVSLVPSEDFHNSEHPDEATYPMEMFGSQLQANILNGLMPFRGRVHCFKVGMFTGSVADGDGNLIEEVDIFEDASASGHVSGADIGTDSVARTSSYTPTSIADLPYAGTSFRRLEVEDQFALSCVNCRDVGVHGDPSTPQPNSERKITADTLGTSPADFFFATPEGQEPAQGLRRIRTRFIDPKNGAVSAPSEELQVFAVAEDEEQPSENLRVRLTGLPVSADPQKTLLQIFMTLVDGGEFFLVGEVDSKSDSFSVPVDDVLTSQVDTVLDFSEGAPPHAHVVGVAQSAMWYGDVTVDGVRGEDVVSFSVPYKPEVVVSGQEAPVGGGDRVGLVGISEYAGQAVLFKRNSIFRANIVSTGGSLALSTREISKNDGAVSAQSIVPFEGRLYFIADRGPMVLFSLEETPVFIGKRIAPYFSNTIDHEALPFISATINRRRDQYIFTGHDASLPVGEDRFAVEFDHPADGDAAVNAVIAGHRFSKYQGPRISALGQALSKNGGPHVLVGGTEEGFIVWMDRSDVRTVMMGPTANIWGSTTLTAGVGNIFSGTVDDVFEGPRGAPLRWLDSSDAEQFGYVNYSYLDDNGDLRMLLAGGDASVSPVPVSSATVSLGALMPRWSTMAMSYDRPELEKEWVFLDVARKAMASGQLHVDVYRDLAAAPESGQPVIDLTKSFETEDLAGCAKEARVLQLVMRTKTPAVDVDFELLDVTVRASVTDNR